MLNDIYHSKNYQFVHFKKERNTFRKFNFSGYIMSERVLEKKIEGQILCALKSMGVLQQKCLSQIISFPAKVQFTELCSFIIATSIKAGLNFFFSVLSTNTKDRLSQNNLNGDLNEHPCNDLFNFQITFRKVLSFLLRKVRSIKRKGPMNANS